MGGAYGSLGGAYGSLYVCRRVSPAVTQTLHDIAAVEKDDMGKTALVKLVQSWVSKGSRPAMNVCHMCRIKATEG